MTAAASALGRPARFISLEGGEGAGKSTVLAALRAALEARGETVVCTREPGGTPLAERIRGLLLQADGDAPTPPAELLLMFAARAQLVSTVIAPALARGDWVLSDRFTDASHVYQGAARGGDAALIETLERRVVGIEPAMTLLLDVPVAVGRARIAGRGAPDRIEAEHDAFFDTVRGAYLARATQHAERFRVVDASRPADEVAEAAVAHLRAHLEAMG
ncbi:dTMP kinase [Cognatilysobacter bugurensis]|uniref:Thymidylate kinase n=1 Tax=Cognatilysobacter bugurensis TaxID=543356 RepID=A0A918W558_9GAMM|nr:dTMP kinase [Lysobacter bugurensis]GHA69913.1 thymidylate kinase [Lysobacter bugurensis]